MSCLSNEYKKRADVYQAVYEGFDPDKVSGDERATKKLNNDVEFTYGEVIFEHFIAVMEYVDPQPGEVFWDLGCGAGKPLISASLAFPKLQACKGLELLE